ncbi:hypothetical protein HanRHA438_Chr11g0517031 [Helianthus annuus]|nr:hypothetical protein HanIR_Chr11g0542911 [Helianthus annuus]KAJ0871843.1 hypothetical protein HanRHA438_Chr11g0517031 [Helianthus annuus]
MLPPDTNLITFIPTLKDRFCAYLPDSQQKKHASPTSSCCSQIQARHKEGYLLSHFHRLCEKFKPIFNNMQVTRNGKMQCY